jgi:hypothetical protein
MIVSGCAKVDDLNFFLTKIFASTGSEANYKDDAGRSRCEFRSCYQKDRMCTA